PIVIPVRDESMNILGLLQSLDRQSADPEKVDIIVVDDHSQDDTVEVVKAFIARSGRFTVRLIQLRNEFSKKSAIARAVQESASQWVVTLDADVSLPGADWLVDFMLHADNDAWMLCGPVVLASEKKNRIVRIATLESIGLLSIAGAGIRSRSPLFCNGASLAFRRDKFIESGGYDTNRLSGDDTDLLHRFPSGNVRFVSDPACLVKAAAPSTLGGFISQRQRWAAKIPASLAKQLPITGLSAWWMHFVVLLLILAGFMGTVTLWCPLAIIAIKAVIEYRVLKASSSVHRMKVPGRLILLLQPVYCLSIVIIGILSVAIPYRWKGRTS
ncbi:MAG: glycosyltransferase, partial [Flavobacteriales bacterium]